MIKIIQKTYTYIDDETNIKAIVDDTGAITFECGNPNKWDTDKNGFYFINSKPETILKVCKSLTSLVKVIQKDNDY